MTCPYITTLERACGRASTHGDFCRFHSVLNDFETRPDLLLNDTLNELYDAIGEITR
jgi:hypothetical protein